MTDLIRLPLIDAARRIAEGSLSSAEYVAAHLERIDAVDGTLNAFLAVMREEAIQEAERADRAFHSGRPLCPLHGIPIAIKDIIDVAGVATTGHSKIGISPLAPADARVVTRLRDAGAIILGKTALHEFATGGPSFDLPWPPARNPWLMSHHPGGSSSGSAAAVAAGMVPGAIGTDTTGSVRHPATACGVVGLKPTYDVLSRQGVFPLAFSQDHVGPIARTVADCAVIYHAIREPGGDQISDITPLQGGADIRGLRIGVLEEFTTEANSEIQSAFGEALNVLSKLGAKLVPLEVPPLEAFTGCGRLILQAEGYAVHANWLRERPQDYGSRARVRLASGATISAESYIKAQQFRSELRHAFARAMQEVDAAVCISSLELPCAIDDVAAVEATYDRQARTPFNVTGSPAIALPIGFASNRLPIGMQVVGHDFDEAMVLRIAAAYEQVTPWHACRPDLASAIASNTTGKGGIHDNAT